MTNLVPAFRCRLGLLVTETAGAYFDMGRLGYHDARVRRNVSFRIGCCGDLAVSLPMRAVVIAL